MSNIEWTTETWKGNKAFIRWDSGEVCYPTKGKGGDFDKFPLSLKVRQFPKLTEALESPNLLTEALESPNLAEA